MTKKGIICGLIVFFLGVILLVVTFVFTLLAFLNPDRIADFGRLIPSSEGDWQSALMKTVGYVVAIVLLMVMGSIGGRITALGIRMFEARPSSGRDQGDNK